MVSKVIIDLLAEEDIDLPGDRPVMHIDDTFVPDHAGEKSSTPESHTKQGLSTSKKLGILDWLSMDRQLRSYGSSKINNLSLNLMDEDTREHIGANSPDVSFDFRSDSTPFAVKYNVAIALSYSEVIHILSDMDACEVYASQEIEKVFRKYGKHMHPGLNTICFHELPLEMKGELIWPMVQNLYRALMIRKAALTFPEGVSGKLAYEALNSEFEDDQLSSQLSNLSALKYSDYETIYFSDLSDLEVKYHVALYCLNHVSEIKPKQSPPPETTPQEDEPEPENEQQQEENVKKLEDDYIAAFKRINKNKSFWDRINLEDIFEMGKDVMEAIKEEVKNFAQLKQGIMSRLAGRSKVSIEDEELLRIVQDRNPNFEFASRYLAMFFQPSDYYGILGLNSTDTVTEKDVKNAFKRQAKIYHPDKNSDDPNKDEKEQRFKLLIAAKDALLKRLGSGKDTISGFRGDVSLTNYLGCISRLFAETASADQEAHQGEIKTMQNIDEYQEEDKPEQDARQNTHNDQEQVQMEADEGTAQEPESEDEYLGPYFEEMLILRSMIDSWADKKVLVIGAGREPDDLSVPVILSRMGVEVSAVDVNYRGPAEYQGCQYFRVSADRVDQMFEEEQFDIVISTAMFGVPFTNWAIREYSLNSFDEGLKDRIRDLELEVIGKLLKLTRKGGVHLHHNRDLNPQSWNFGEEDLKHIGCESAFQPEKLPNPRETWFLKK